MIQTQIGKDNVSTFVKDYSLMVKDLNTMLPFKDYEVAVAHLGDEDGRLIVISKTYIDNELNSFAWIGEDITDDCNGFSTDDINDFMEFNQELICKNKPLIDFFNEMKTWFKKDF